MYEAVATSIVDKAVSSHAAFDQLLKTNAANGIVTPLRLQSWHPRENRTIENANKSPCISKAGNPGSKKELKHNPFVRSFVAH